MSALKRCLECEQCKPHQDFYRSKAITGGLSALCKNCLHRYGSLCPACGEHTSIRDFFIDALGFLTYCRKCREGEDTSVKRCSYCKKEKPLVAFGRYKRTKDGFVSRCKECRSFTRGYRKTCSGCGEGKNNRDFPKKGLVPDVFTSYCLICVQKYPTYTDTVRKQCSSCKEVKSAQGFHKDRWSKDGLCFHCKTCRSSRVA